MLSPITSLVAPTTFTTTVFVNQMTNMATTRDREAW
jgi:hypothetical protein